MRRTALRAIGPGQETTSWRFATLGKRRVGHPVHRRPAVRRRSPARSLSSGRARHRAARRSPCRGALRGGGRWPRSAAPSSRRARGSSASARPAAGAGRGRAGSGVTRPRSSIRASTPVRLGLRMLQTSQICRGSSGPSSRIARRMRHCCSVTPWALRIGLKFEITPSRACSSNSGRLRWAKRGGFAVVVIVCLGLDTGGF